MVLDHWMMTWKQFPVDFFIYLFFYLGVVEQHGIICGQGHTQTFVQEVF